MTGYVYFCVWECACEGKVPLRSPLLAIRFSVPSARLSTTAVCLSTPLYSPPFPSTHATFPYFFVLFFHSVFYFFVFNFSSVTAYKFRFLFFSPASLHFSSTSRPLFLFFISFSSVTFYKFPFQFLLYF